MSFTSKLELDIPGKVFTGYDGANPDVSGFIGKARVFYSLGDAAGGWNNATDKWDLSGTQTHPSGLTLTIDNFVSQDENGFYFPFHLSGEWLEAPQATFMLKAERGWPYSDKTATFTARASRLESDVLGCMDPTALNFNPSASVDDGSCNFTHTDFDQESEDDALRAPEIATEYTTDLKPLDDILPMTPLIYDGKDLNITLDLRNITYKPEPLAEILDPGFKSY